MARDARRHPAGAHGFPVITRNDAIRVVVPASRIRFGGGEPPFTFDAVSCYMRVSAPAKGEGGGAELPMLGVYEVFDVLSGDLSLPYTVARQ